MKKCRIVKSLNGFIVETLTQHEVFVSKKILKIEFGKFIVKDRWTPISMDGKCYSYIFGQSPIAEFTNLEDAETFVKKVIEIDNVIKEYR